MAKKFPPTMYGHWEDEGDENEYFRTSEDAAQLVEAGEARRVGVYKLVGYTEVRNETIVGAVIQKARGK